MAEPTYFFSIDNKQAGPFTPEQVREMLKAGTVSGATLYWVEGQAGWEPLSKIASSLGIEPSGLPPGLPPSLSPVGAHPSSYAPAVGNTETSGLAITSLVLGILGILCQLTSIPAVICGHIALGKIKASAGVLTGKGMAIAGLVLGYLGAALFALSVVAVMAGIALPVFGAVQERGKLTKDLTQIRKIYFAIDEYVGDNKGFTPPDLDALVPKYLPEKAALLSAFSTDSAEEGFELLLPKTEFASIPDRATTPLVQGIHVSSQGKRCILYADGHAAIEAN